MLCSDRFYCYFKAQFLKNSVKITNNSRKYYNNLLHKFYTKTVELYHYKIIRRLKRNIFYVPVNPFHFLVALSFFLNEKNRALRALIYSAPAGRARSLRELGAFGPYWWP